MLKSTFNYKVVERSILFNCHTTTRKFLRSMATHEETFEKINHSEQFGWLQQYAPRFAMSGENVHIIEEPAEFYNTLVNRAKTARKRIILAALYLGTDKLEQELINTIYNTAKECQEKGHGLDVQVLLDCSRGSRGKKNSRTMLLPLVKEFDETTSVSLYHTPNMYGLMKRVLPERWNEVVGLAHIKIYIFDDDLIISGANLSESYFTNRQDRYVWLKKVPAICNFYQHLISSISSMSFQLCPDNTLKLHETNEIHPYLNDDKGASFKKELYKRVISVIKPSGQIDNAKSDWKTMTSDKTIENHGKSAPLDTWVYPLVQMGECDINVDAKVTEEFFRRTVPLSQVYLASGYFNLTDHYINVIMNKAKGNFNILTASPEANGFFNGKGLSGKIPDVYTQVAKTFYNVLCTQNHLERIKLKEYSRSGWTFHGKGLWYYLPGQTLPSLTFVGSPNFGYRSVYRDLESQLVILTNNEHLRKTLHNEQLSLYKYATEVTKETFTQSSRKVPLWVSKVTKVIQTFF